MGIHEHCTQRLVVRSPKLRLNTGLEIRQRAATGVHLITVYPEMASTETALCAFSKIEDREVHRDHQAEENSGRGLYMNG
jgi:hypothetical protein